MKLFLLENNHKVEWDTYHEAVVAAEDEETARHIHPNGKFMTEPYPEHVWQDWDEPDNIDVTYIGEAVEGTYRSVILANFVRG